MELSSAPILSFLGQWELLAILGIVVLLFGASKLPGLGSGIGSFIRNFKKSMKDSELDVTPEDKKSDPEKIDSKKSDS